MLRDPIPDLSKEIVVKHGGPPRILIIDDDMGLCMTLSKYVELARCQSEIANSYAQAMEAMKKAQEDGKPFSVATIDRRFVVGEGDESFSALEGSAILHYIKVEYPEVSCLMISGESITPSEVLDLRDFHGLDYYLSKDLISPFGFVEAVSRAVQRNQVVRNQDKYYGSDAKSLNQGTSNPITNRDLREVLDTYFDEEELRDLCFEFDKEYDSLKGTGTSGKARELISFSRRHGRFFELVELCKRLRPHAFTTDN